MSELNRVFVTGLGALTASGATVEENWASIANGQTAINPIQQWDISSWEYKLGGEIREFKPAQLLPDRKLMKMISRQDVMGIHAAVQAVEHSQLIHYRDTLSSVDAFNDDTAVFVGSPGNKYYQQYDFLPLLTKSHGEMQSFAQQLFDEVHPMWLLKILPNNVLAYTGITYGFKGANHNITNHAVGGMQALIEAYHAVRTGQAKRALVVAYDMGIEPQALFYYEKLGVISAQHLKPFDREHDGTILAEGAAALLLESEASVLERNATCHAEILGGSSSSEGAGLFSIEADGHSLANVMRRTMAINAISPEEIGLIVAHGNGNQKSDISEACALTAVFEERQAPVTAFKWAMGHTLCASGVLDTVLATYALRERSVPGIAGLNQLASACESLNAQSKTREMEDSGSCALVINRGFASMNACLAIKACD